jgi:ATP-dependent Clp protease protease subunit
MFNIKHIIFSFCFILFIDTSSPFNININSSRRNFIAKSLASNGLINLSANTRNNNENNIININKEEEQENEANQILLSNNYPKHFKNNNIYFTGHLNEETCFHLNEALINHKNMALTQQDYPNHINLYIQSPGGSLLPTLALVDEIKNLGVPIHTYIRGYAASAATLLSVVGSHRYMYNHSVLMIHSVKLHDQEPSTLLDVKDLNTNVDVFMDIIKNIYLENSNIDSKTLDELFNHDIWMNSRKALNYGLIDEII